MSDLGNYPERCSPFDLLTDESCEGHGQIVVHSVGKNASETDTVYKVGNFSSSDKCSMAPMISLVFQAAGAFYSILLRH